MSEVWEALKGTLVQMAQGQRSKNADDKNTACVSTSPAFPLTARVATLAHSSALHVLRILLKLTDLGVFDDTRQVSKWNNMVIFTH